MSDRFRNTATLLSPYDCHALFHDEGNQSPSFATDDICNAFATGFLNFDLGRDERPSPVKWCSMSGQRSAVVPVRSSFNEILLLMDLWRGWCGARPRPRAIMP